MGKAADNERIKIRATFWNNLAVGIALAGVILPLLTLYTWEAEVDDWLSQLWAGKATISAPMAKRIAGAFTASAFALWLALLFHANARDELHKLED